jgi:hypothetical protein
VDQPDRFELATELLGPLPVINAFCARLGLAALLESYLPREDARLRLTPATAVGVVVGNLVIGREPVYALGEWAAPFDPALLGLADRCGSNDSFSALLVRLLAPPSGANRHRQAAAGSRPAVGGGDAIGALATGTPGSNVPRAERRTRRY